MNWLFVSIFVLGLGLIVILVLKVSSSVNQSLNSITGQLNDRLKETAQALQNTHKTVGDRLDSATRVFGDVQKSLGRLEETHRQIFEISKDIASLQQLLRVPKFRGEVAETLLGKLLEDILPKENIRLQHRFSTGDIVDAAVVIGTNLIPIDAKFPLENFKKAQDLNTEEERKTAYRTFIRDVKSRIDEISSKYILPDENTFDFALMYIPAEAVYHQISRDEEINAYAKAKKVVFVSPNTFYAYLQAILFGLKGVNVQRNIRKIFSQLSSLQLDLRKFQDDFDVVGVHIQNAAKKFSEAKNKLTTFNDKLVTAADSKKIEKAEKGGSNG